jgi:hypothetical protein
LFSLPKEKEDFYKVSYQTIPDHVIRRFFWRF